MYSRHHVLVDSADRPSSSSTSAYSVRFASHDDRTGDVYKNVVGVDIVHACFPRAHENIVAGMNTLRVAAFTSARSVQIVGPQPTGSVQAVLDALNDAFSSVDIVVTVHRFNHAERVVTSRDVVPFFGGARSRPASAPQRVARFVLKSRSSPFTLYSTDPLGMLAAGTQSSRVCASDTQGRLELPDLDLRKDDDATLDVGDPILPLAPVYVSDELVVSVPPGVYVSDAHMILELLVGIATAASARSPQSSFPVEEGGDPDASNFVADASVSQDNGWFFRSTSSAWSLCFSTSYAAYIALALVSGDTYGTHGSLLRQLGSDVATRNGGVHFFHRTSDDTGVNSSIAGGGILPVNGTAVDDTAASVGASGGTFAMHLRPVDLLPIRFVDIILDDLPRTLRKATTASSASRRSEGLVSARVALVDNHIVETSVKNGTAGENARSAVSQSSYVVYAPSQDRILGPHPDACGFTLNGLGVKIIDNYGMAYRTTRDHTIEIVITTTRDVRAIPTRKPEATHTPEEEEEEEDGERDVVKGEKRWAQKSNTMPLISVGAGVIALAAAAFVVYNNHKRRGVQTHSLSSQYKSSP